MGKPRPTITRLYAHLLVKKSLLLLLGLAIGLAVAAWLAPKPLATSPDNLAAREARWEAERQRLQTALRAARERADHVPTAPQAKLPATIIHVVAKLSAAESLDQLTKIKISKGPGQNIAARRVVVLLENLIALGSESLPVIRTYLAGNTDITYDTDLGGALDGPKESKDGKDGKAPKEPKADKDGKSLRQLTDFIVPPSLVFGLFDVLRRIGGPEAERIMADTLALTGRGAEVYYLARVLEDSVPGKYREPALLATRDLLVNPMVKTRATRLDQLDRDYLYAVLMMFGDRSFIALAKSQLLRPDGTTDPAALRYLQLAQQADAITTLTETLRDPRLKDPKEKEPLLKEALSFTGADPRANQLLHSVVTDEQLPLKLREKSLNDLDKHGFENPNNLTARDQQIVLARLLVLQALRPDLHDPQLTAAWDKSYTKLIALRDAPAAKANEKAGKKAP